MTRLLSHVPRRYPGRASYEIAASDSRRSFSAQYRRSRSHLAVALASVGHCVTDFVCVQRGYTTSSPGRNMVHLPAFFFHGHSRSPIDKYRGCPSILLVTFLRDARRRRLLPATSTARSRRFPRYFSTWHGDTASQHCI